MIKTADIIDRIICRVGFVSIWLVLLMVILQFFIVVLRYVFGISFVEMQETVTIAHGLVFMLAAGWVLQQDKHVRVDIFYADSSQRTKTIINMFGAVLFLTPISLVIWCYSWAYVGESWSIFEGSPDTDLRVRYLQKSAILVFALLMGLQGIAILLRGYLLLRISPAKHDS